MSASLILDLTRRYQEPQRNYHTLEHVASMLHAARELSLDEEQTMAIWFHDAIYDPTSDQNEQKSARLASKWLAKVGWPVEAIERVGRMVLDTRAHLPSTPQAAAVIDLDLMSLASPWSRFTSNSAAIRAEHAHLSDADYVAGRSGFFRAMLARPRIFHTEWGAALEQAARSNLERVLSATD